MSGLHCPCCGDAVQQLHQGYCHDCLEQRVHEHLREVFENDRWARMSPAEREREIRDAVRRA